MSSAKGRILGTARELIEASGAVPSMAELARAAGISRQALYLHFPDRVQLLLALVAFIDKQDDLGTGLAAVRAAPCADGQVRAWAVVQTWHNPRIAAVARALDSVRHTDQAAATAWNDRAADRMRDASAIVERVRAEGRLDRGWTDGDAATLLWELTSFRVWDDLVNHAGIAPERYVEMITAAALAALGAPPA